MSLGHSILEFLCGPPPKKRPGAQRVPTPEPVAKNGANQIEAQRPRQPPKPRPQPAGLTVHQFQEALGLASKLVVVRSSLPILSYCLLKNG